jgi:hypothetical protein
MGERCPCSFQRAFFCVVRLRLAPSPSPSFPGGQRALWWALGERRTETQLTDVTFAFCTTRRTKRSNAGVPTPAFGGPPAGEAISGDEQMGEIGGDAPAGGAAEPAGVKAELKNMRLRSAKLHVYAGHHATPGDGFSANFTMQFCAVAAGLDGSAREVQNCYNSENHVKEHVDIGLDLGLDGWVKEQWEHARRRYRPKAIQAKLRAETTRADWYTPPNLERYYDVAADMLVDAGIARRVEGFDRTKEYAHMLIIDHPERMLSYDETAVTMDETDGTKSKTMRIITSGKGDDGTTTATKSSKGGTGTGGRIGESALPIYVVFGGSETVNAKWTADPAVGNVLRNVMIDDGKGGEVEDI